MHALHALMQAPPPAPSAWVILLAAVLKVVAPTIAGLIFTEYTKVIAFVQQYGAVAVGIVGVLYGALAAWAASHIPGVVFPPAFSDWTVDGITGLLTGLIALFTHVQITQKAKRVSLKLKF